MELNKTGIGLIVLTVFVVLFWYTTFMAFGEVNSNHWDQSSEIRALESKINTLEWQIEANEAAVKRNQTTISNKPDNTWEVENLKDRFTSVSSSMDSRITANRNLIVNNYSTLNTRINNLSYYG